MVVLIELKCRYVISVPGFNVLRSAGKEARGGVAVLISNGPHLALCTRCGCKG